MIATVSRGLAGLADGEVAFGRQAAIAEGDGVGGEAVAALADGPRFARSATRTRRTRHTPAMSQSAAADRIPDDLSQLEEEAAKVLSPEALAYILAGAGDTDTMRANAAAFRRWRIRRRKGRKPAKVDLSTTVLGTRMPAPVLFAPVGVQELAHPDAELASARAAAELGLTYVHSTQASHPMEQVAAANGNGSRWYQLYWPTDDELAVSFLRRAKAAGYTHLIITLDTTLLGWRPLDLDRGYSPFLENKGLANYTSDPVFRRRMPVPAEVSPLTTGIAFAGVFQNPGLNWGRLPLIRANWDGPILLKGIQSPLDARLAVEHEIDGIVVSNHGGRQVDGAIASLDALGPIVKAVGDKMPVLFDSGIRTGRDVFKALALGADAVLIGRPYVYGLALEGQAGTRTVMRMFVDELEDEVRKAGHRGHRSLSRTSLSRAR
jgi:lactate 2-monooxygenase